MDGTSPQARWDLLTAGALYTGIERGLAADILVTRALGGRAHPVCTSMVVASHGHVTDVVEVPSDTVAAKLEHLSATVGISGVKVGIVGSHASVPILFDALEALNVPFVLDITLSGPSGEDIADERTRDAIVERLHAPDLVTIRKHDAALLVGMEINTLDDAQVAVQRFQKLGARQILIRCGQIQARFFEENGQTEPFAVDLFHDGNDFGLFEAPYIDLPEIHGASSALTIAIVRELIRGVSMTEALQVAKAFVSEALHHAQQHDAARAPSYFWQHE